VLVINAFPCRKRATNPPFYRSYHLANYVFYNHCASNLCDDNVKMTAGPFKRRSNAMIFTNAHVELRENRARRDEMPRIRDCRHYLSRCETFSYFVSYKKFVQCSFLVPAWINYHRVMDLHHMSTLSGCWWLSRVILSQHGVPGSRFVISCVYTTFHRTFLRQMINDTVVALWLDECYNIFGFHSHNSLHGKNLILPRVTRRKSDTPTRLFTCLFFDYFSHAL